MPNTEYIDNIVILQQDTDRLSAWMKNWQMEFNMEKYVMHFNKKNQKTDYLKFSKVQKD